MKIRSHSVRASLSSVLFVAFACACWIQFAPAARAQDPDPTPVVGYAPKIKNIQGVLPYTEAYTLDITAPYNQPTTTSTISFMIDITSAAAIPEGVSPATAISYVTITPAQVVFTGPNEVRSVTVQLSLPANATPGAYGYKIRTTGWPVNPALGLSNDGADINASITAAAQPLTPPVVGITIPQHNDVFTVQVGGFPASIPLTFSASGPGPYPSPIDSISYTVDGSADAINLTSLTGLNTLSVTGIGTMLVNSPGEHSVTVSAHNGAGTASATTTFTIVVNAPPPTVTINTPPDGASFDYYVGSPALSIPFKFTGVSAASVIRTLSAKLDGQAITFIPSGYNTATATGTTALSLTAGGTHTLAVTAYDDYSSASTTSTFNINVITPTPTISIDNPDADQVFIHTTGEPALNIPFTFYANTTAGFAISSVAAKLNGANAAIESTTGLGTPSTTSTGVFAGLSAGSYTFTAYGTTTGTGQQVSTSVTFRIVDVAPIVPPTVVINTPTEGSTYTLLNGTVSVPLNFTGTSHNVDGVITGMTATLDGNPVTITWPAGQGTPTATATVPVTTTGSHTFKVTATDIGGTAIACQSFAVVASTEVSLNGVVFYDINLNGVQEAGDPGLAGVVVLLKDYSTGATVATTTSAADGSYSFTVTSGSSYLVDPITPAGLALTTTALSGSKISVATSSITVAKTGFGLNFAAIRTMKSTALSQGFWKNNVSKNLAKKPKGVQVSLADIQAYTDTIASGLAGTAFNGLTMTTASSLFNSKNQLQLQLLAAEYNYASGAYIGGNQALTYAFICWGEAVLLNPNGYYSSSYQTFAAKWFESYNTSEGGYVLGPLP